MSAKRSAKRNYCKLEAKGDLATNASRCGYCEKCLSHYHECEDGPEGCEWCRLVQASRVDEARAQDKKYGGTTLPGYDS